VKFSSRRLTGSESLIKR